VNAVDGSARTLVGLLDRVDDDRLRQVMRLVEGSRQRRTLEPALAALRPRLRRLRPERPLTLPRLLTVPFEAALACGCDDGRPFSIDRAKLHDWHATMLDGLDKSTRDAAAAVLADRRADDHRAILAAGRIVWPQAARLLAAAQPIGETAAERTARHRAADLLGIAVELVPLLDRLRPPLERVDAEQKASVAALLALAESGPPDRLATLAMLLMRAAAQPAALAGPLLALAPPALRAPLRPVLDVLLDGHRADLERRLEAVAAAGDRPLELLADELWRLADALVGPPNAPAPEAGPDPATMALRQQAATVAEAHYAATVASVVEALPEAGHGTRAAAVKEREQAARRLARLGLAARRLAPQAPIQRLTEAALHRLLAPVAAADGAAAQPISVDDARLVEILLGPDAAWQLLRPEAARR